MRSVIIAIIMIALLALAVHMREARAEAPDYRDWAIHNQKIPDCYVSAKAEFAVFARYAGIDPHSPRFAREQREYVEAVCLPSAEDVR
jgi:hypothetical protein